MLKVNTQDIEEEWSHSPKGKFASGSRAISEALGRDPHSSDLNLRHPFDVEILRVPPGKIPYPYHAHSAQWEFYHVISGAGSVRHAEGISLIKAGDAFIFRPGEAHQFENNGQEDLVVYVVADNPIGESVYYPDSGKWLVRSPERRLMRGDPLEYYEGEE